MAKVKNWQIGREMDYPYDEVRPDKQFAAIFDINKCIGCQTCTIACKQHWTSGRGQEYMFWNNVETKPYGFYPLGWDVKLLSLMGTQQWEGTVYKGKTIFEMPPPDKVTLGYLPDDIDYAHPNIGEDEPYDPANLISAPLHLAIPHQLWSFYLQRICNHCTYPACVAACPRKAIYKRKEDGIVLIDQKRCRGYRECVRACPYKKVFYNPATRISEKCIACFPHIEQGKQTQCTITCIGKIRLVGWLNTPEKADPNNPVDYLVHVKKVALPLYPQSGLEPNIYYIPPIHVPDKYLIQMFGPGVSNAKRTYRTAETDNTLLGAFMLFGATPKIISKFTVTTTEVKAWDDKNVEIVSVPFKEPYIIRDYFDSTRQIYRHNTP